MSREPRPLTDEELRERLGYGGPKLDLIPELLGFVTHLFVVGAILWALGYF